MLPSIWQCVVGVNAVFFIGRDFRKLVFHVLSGTVVEDFYVVTPFDKGKIRCLVAVAVIGDAYSGKIRLRE